MIFATAVLLAFFAISAVFLYLHLTRNFNYWKHRNVDFVKPRVFFGNLLDVFTFKTFVGDFFHDLHRSTSKPFLGFFGFDKPYLLVRDPQIIKHIMVKDFDHFSDRSVHSNRNADRFGAGLLFLVKNPIWRTVRIKLTPSMSSGKIKNMTPLMLHAAKSMIEYISEKVKHESVLPAREIAMKNTTDVIVSCAYAINANCFLNEDAEFRVISRRVFKNTYSRAVSALSYYFSPLLVNFFKLKWIEKKTTCFLKDIFEERLLERMKTRAYRGDIIDVLLHLKEKDKETAEFLDHDILASQALQFFVAGFETTGSTVFFTLYELAHNLDVQATLRENIAETLEKYGSLTYEALNDMTYLDMVISETLRKYPVLPFLDRRCTKPFKIPNTDVVIDKGIAVYMSLFGLHYDPEYFPNPEKYDPERFSAENKSKIPNFVYMPFGEGLHNCIGTRFAQVNVKVSLSHLILNFEISSTESTAYPMVFHKKAFMLTPDSEEVYLNFKPVSNDQKHLL